MNTAQPREKSKGMIRIILVKNCKEVNQVRIKRNGARRLKQEMFRRQRDGSIDY